MLSLDTETRLAYDAASTSAAKAQAVIDAIQGATVYVRVYNASDLLMGAGTMQSPWATRSGSTITLGEVQSFTVQQAGTPGAGWYLQVESGTRWVRGSFGPGSDFTWSLATWEVGQLGVIGTATMTVPGATAENTFSAVYSNAGATSFFGWTIPATTLSIGTITAGGTYSLAQYASTASGTPVYLIFSAPSDVTVDQATGLLRIGSSVPAGTYSSIIVSLSNGGSNPVNRTFSAVVQAAQTFDGLSLFGFDSLTPVYLPGLGFGLSGTNSVGVTYGDNSPLPWGGKGYTPPFYIQDTGVPARTAFGTGGGYAHDLEFRNVTGPTGATTRALYSSRTTAYSSSNYQLAAQWRPNTSLTQGMFYLRFWFRWLTGWKSKGGSFWVLSEAKNNTSAIYSGQRVDAPDRVNWTMNPEGDYLLMGSESFSGGSMKGVSWGTPDVYGYHSNWGTSFYGLPAENEWVKFEAAARYSAVNINPPTAGAGWAWCALTDSAHGTRTLSYAGQNIPDLTALAPSRGTAIGRLFNWLDYHNGSAGRQTEITGVELRLSTTGSCWPSDASTHPSNYT